jgi:2-polyprenyl-6-methoxyphenol hydroxylase-like FAD-dependent oxidoreductase
MSRILIAGAGIGGLTAALALLRHDHEVHLFEQATELREVGAGVQLSANGTCILIELGLRAAMQQIVCEPAGKEIRLWNTGQTWPLFDLGGTSVARYGAPYWMVHRGDFHAALLDAVQRAAPNAIRTAAAVTGFQQTDTEITLHLASGEQVQGDALIGADGVHSAIRQQMFGAGRAQFTGIMAWRGLIPMQRLPGHLQRLVGTNWNGRGGHVVTYPLRRGEIMNFVGALERNNWLVESWTECGTIEECARDFADWHPDIQTMIHAIDTPYKWALLGREPLPRFSVGRATLLGDAAHPTLPFLAQGANMAIEDGMILARCLAQHTDIPTALRRYEAARLARTAAIVRGSNDNAKRFHNPALTQAATAADYIDREWTPEKTRDRYDWLYDYDARTIPI